MKRTWSRNQKRATRGRPFLTKIVDLCLSHFELCTRAARAEVEAFSLTIDHDKSRVDIRERMLVGAAFGMTHIMAEQL